MAKGRKTFEVERIKEMANARMAQPTVSDDERKAIFWFTEAILFETKSYHGFNWVHWAYERGFEDWRAAGSPEGSEKEPYITGGDNYRRFFY